MFYGLKEEKNFHQNFRGLNFRLLLVDDPWDARFVYLFIFFLIRVFIFVKKNNNKMVKLLYNDSG